ncbi:MAG: PSD1 domain-containing protein [Planctomycetaceae bacterium]|nr:PSD1 domain-containing protein [Planctomycetaceae bacterium]
MMRRQVLSLAVLLLVQRGALCAAEKARADEVRFNRDVRPILSENCFACHGFDASAREAGLRLDTRAGSTSAQAGAAAVVAGDSGKSQLIARIMSSDDDQVMPPPHSNKRLTADEKETLRQWIDQGAEYEAHWSLALPRRPVLPPISWTDHPIDRFIQARLDQEKLAPSPLADAATLIRRTSLDLTGLPPTLAEVDSFLEASAIDAEAAYHDLVDRLLRSPHYGERWGRWWLDQARYADSNGYSIDAPRQIWKYRDWVIEALNADMPFNQFTIEQLAGDLLPGAAESQKVATGFHRNTQINEEGGIDKEQFRIDGIFDRVATTGTVWLGLTVGCAQCHDHKFDPIEQREFYGLFAFFNSQDEPAMKVFGPGVDVDRLTAEFAEAERQAHAYVASRASELATWESGLTPEMKSGLSPEIEMILALPPERRSGEQTRTLFAAGFGEDPSFRRLHDRLWELDEALNRPVTTLVMAELPQPRKTTVLINGDFTRPGEEVAPGTPAALHPFAPPSGRPTRLDLARWIVSPQNPLTARVIVNRIWQQYFGRGIVETENDFGLQGAAPSHPELLDWLAVEFMERQWSLKEMHRLIVTSHTYRQRSADRPELRDADPRNYLLGRQQRIRLDAEIIRDVGLAASGLLSPKLGGPPVYPPIPAGVMSQGQVARDWTVSPGADKNRRGLYTFAYRASPPPFLNVFDAPDGVSCCTRRIRSNTPLQALTLMNDAAFMEFAVALEHIIKKDGLETAFRRCLARSPEADELAVLKRLDALTAARTLLNLDETVTRD